VGDRSGFLSAGTSLASVKITGSLESGNGSDSGYISAGTTLGPVSANFIVGAQSSRVFISAGSSIAAVTVNESASFADIIAGYTVNGTPFNPNAQIGTIKVGVGTGPGTVTGVNIIAGMTPGSDGQFGTSDDVPISSSSTPSISKIASIIVGSVVSTSSSLDSYGFEATNIGALKIGSTVIPLHGGPRNDFFQPVAALSDTSYGEAAGLMGG